jgi:hypothetical protein
MDGMTQPAARRSHRKWIIVVVAVVLVSLVALFWWASRRPVVVTGEHIGGNVFSMTNHSEMPLLVNVMIEVQNNGQWSLANAGAVNINMEPHESRRYFFSGFGGGPIVPTQPWRLHGAAAKDLHGIAAKFQLWWMYWDMRRRGLNPRFNPRTSTGRVTKLVGEFFAYPAVDPAGSQLPAGRARGEP